MKPDVIIIGSGFGGAVHACRLAQAGRAVLVLERGRRWDPSEYPRSGDDAWFYDMDEPHRQNGWLDLRPLGEVWVAQGAGVGGGSLIYANVVIDAKPEVFDAGWPAEITYDALRPHYETVAEVMNTQVLPDNQLTPRFELMREAAAKTGAADRFRKVDLAVSFDPEGRYPGIRPTSAAPTRTFTNAQGRKQGYCVHCGNCDIGCKARAKNTLDLNYLAMAEDAGAEIRPLSVVSDITAEGDGFAVRYDDVSGGERVPRVVRAPRVVLAAGSLGSTEILFRSRDGRGGLPNVSRALGLNWTSNGDFLTPAFYKGRELSPSIGPTITAAIDYLDGADGGARYFVEDGGFPDVVGNMARAGIRGPSLRGRIIGRMARMFADGDPLETMMPWFGQAMDGGGGTLRWRRS
jgi:cholesterol oxidase